MPTQTEAARFLTQATFGPTSAEIQRLSGMTYAQWIEEQFAKPQTLHRLYMNQAAADLASVGQQLSRTNFFDSYWSQAISGEDQLRQRAAFALSEIMVISFTDATLSNQPRGVSSYYDMLAENAFGNFRKLIEDVSLHPMMGIYLTWLGNQKEDAATGRVPDLNFAREITQLFTIGEWMLNPDGTYVLDSNGKPAVAYTGADLAGLAQVFTGFSWYAGPNTSDRTNRRYFGNDANLERDWRPMQAYNEYAAEHRVPFGEREDLPRRDDPGADQGRQRGRPEDRARHAVQPPERRPVHLQAADPANWSRATRAPPTSVASRRHSTTTAAACAAT